MGETWGGDFVGKALAEENIEYAFGLHGGHVWSLMAGLGKNGIKHIHPFRHEQAAGYAADGWARASGKVGVFYVTAGPGVTNAISAISQAHLCHSPVVALLGQHSPIYDGRGPLQEAYGTELCGTISKWAKRVVNIDSLYFNVKRAIVDSQAYPPGPVVLELPFNVLWGRGDEEKQQGYVPGSFPVTPSQPAADPAEVEKAVKSLLDAERPAFIGGDGLYWSNASEELREFAELFQIPVQTRRMGRGALPEDHPLAFRGPGTRGKILGNADLILTMGFCLNHLEAYGNPPTDPLNPGPWNRETKFIQVGESLEEFCILFPTKQAIIGSPRLVLKQMIDCAKSMIKGPPKRTQWLKEVKKAQEATTAIFEEEVAKALEDEPIHPRLIGQEVVNSLDESSTVIFDGFTLSSYASDQIICKFAGQILDAGTHTGVGHGVGMSIGAQLARPGKPVVVLLGDGGIGVGGMDIETAARLNLPVCFVVDNNARWMGYLWDNIFRHWHHPSWGMQEGIRYDKMFEECGCHGEHVTDAEGIRPAMERALSSGKTSVVNIVRKNLTCNPWVARAGAMIPGADSMSALPPEVIQEVFPGIPEDAYETAEVVLRDRIPYTL